MTTPYTIPNPPTPLQQLQLLAGTKSVVTWVGWDTSVWPISGGLAPDIAVQDGVVVTNVKGGMGNWKHYDQASAHQDGTTWLDATWDIHTLDLDITIAAQTPHGYRHVARGWFNAHDPKLTGTLCWFTPELGEWWLTCRLAEPPEETSKVNPGFQTRGDYTWHLRADQPFWSSFDSISSLVASSATVMADPLGINVNGFLSLFNRGDQLAWPRYLVQGPLTTITIADGDSGGYVTFGPLAAGETVLMTTEPRIQTVTNLTSGANLYPLLSGRFQTSIPAQAVQPIAVTVTGATSGVTQINGSLTPLRKWPE